MSVTEKYRDFILDLIKDSHKTQLIEPEGGGKYVSWKLGPAVGMDVRLEILERYTRSAKLKLVFDKYEVEQLFFMPLNSSPESILSKVYRKIDAIVNNTLIGDGREDEIKKMYTDKREKMFTKVKDLTLL